MEINVKHIAKLARLHISDIEAAKYEKEMTDIVAMVENLPPLESADALIDTNNKIDLRDDEIKPSFPRSEMLANVPEVAAGCIVVPKTV
ncbi:MAG: Asp-tRNA(Asn)/Glu-tRNA(Gln) amidotransferase subunit GatC [Oscillospiraceae bacterium]